MNEKALEHALKKKKLRKVIFQVEKDDVEEEEVHLKRKSRQHVDTFMSSAVIASARIFVVASVENAGEVTQHTYFVLREQLGSNPSLMTSAHEVFKLAQDFASKAYNKVSSSIVAYEVVPEASTTNVDPRKGCADGDLIVKDHTTEEGFSTKKPITVEATSCDSLNLLFNSTPNSSLLIRKSSTPSSSESSEQTPSHFLQIT